MKSKIELQCPEQLELQRYQFNILQYEIAVASSRKDELVKVCTYVCTLFYIYYAEFSDPCVCKTFIHLLLYTAKRPQGKTSAVFLVFRSTENLLLGIMVLLIESISQHQCYNKSFTESLCESLFYSKRERFLL